MFVTYRTKIDLWLAALIVVALGTSSVAVVLAAIAEGDQWLIPVLLAPILLVWALSWPTTYTLTESELVVRSGLIRWRIALSDITGCRPTRSPLSSPAWSLDRLRIDYGRGKWIMISPSYRDRFVADLEARVGRKLS